MNSNKEKENETQGGLKTKCKERTNTHINSDEVQRTHRYNYENNHDPYIHYQHTNT